MTEETGTLLHGSAPVFNCVSCLLTVEGRVGEIDIFLVHLFLGQTNGLAEALEMDDLALSEETNHIIDIRIVAKTKNVIIGYPGLLFCSHILGKVGNDITLDADTSCVPGRSGSCSGIDACGMIHKIGSKGSTVSDFFVGEFPGELVDNGADHLQVAQLLGTYKGVKMEPQTEAACAARDSSLVSGSK